LRVNRVFLCEKKGQNVSFMACPLCEYYSCSQLTSDHIRELNVSPLMDRRIVKLIPRRCKLFIIKYLDGTLKEAPELDPNNPDRHLMQDVDTVFQIGKELVPVIVLKPKPKQDRDRITKEAAEAKAKKN
jgi:hypothetical protein